jgi:hypothetical protein
VSPASADVCSHNGDDWDAGAARASQFHMIDALRTGLSIQPDVRGFPECSQISISTTTKTSLHKLEDLADSSARFDDVARVSDSTANKTTAAKFKSMYRESGFLSVTRGYAKDLLTGHVQRKLAILPSQELIRHFFLSWIDHDDAIRPSSPRVTTIPSTITLPRSSAPLSSPSTCSARPRAHGERDAVSAEPPTSIRASVYNGHSMSVGFPLTIRASPSPK